jgi:hypothetical protein
VARRQPAKALELRAAMSLSHLYRQQGREAEPDRCWPRLTAGSPRGSIPRTCGRRRHSSQNSRDRGE